jgi:endonuclease VIII
LVAEGDSIHRLARRLHEQLVGARITSAQFRRARNDSLELTDLTFKEVVPLGKHLLMRLSGRQHLTIHSHLRMQGRWTVVSSGKNLPPKVADQTRLRMTLKDGRTLAAIDMPVLDVIPTDQEATVIGHVGPDVLADNFDINTAAARVQREPARTAVEALLDQRNVSGLGNLWVIETLFLRGVHPDRPVGDIDASALLALSRRMMLYSRDVAPGMITTGDRRKGRTHWVYGRAGRPCLRCDTPIAFRPGNGSAYRRETWWCPHCQPASLEPSTVPPM